MTIIDCVDWFYACVYEVYHKEYLCKPIACDIEILYLAREERHEFLGMIGSLDCTYVTCEKCPNTWRGQFT